MWINRRYDNDMSLDTDDDRDLVARFNEARDPAELHRLTAMARHRRRARRRAAAHQAIDTSRARGSRFGLGRALGARH